MEFAPPCICVLFSVFVLWDVVWFGGGVMFVAVMGSGKWRSLFGVVSAGLLQPPLSL